MQRSATAKREIILLLLLCTVIFSGCGSRRNAELYIYCNETFWYVMQEEALVFNKIYGFQVILIPVRASRTASKVEEDSVEIGSDWSAPVLWQSRPRNQSQTDLQATDPHTQINLDIEQQLTRIAKESFGDLFLSDSQKHLEKLRVSALSVNEYPICYLTLTMLVPEGNPYQFRSVKEVLEAHRKLGIVDPSFDGLGESSWKMLGKIVSGGESAIPLDLVRLYERQYDLLEALEQGKIDAALVWNATSLVNFLLIKYADAYNAANEKIMREAERRQDWEKLRKILQAIHKKIVEENSFAEAVPLTENPDEHCVIAIRLVALGSASNYGYCERFADFMRSKKGKDVLQRFGFVTE